MRSTIGLALSAVLTAACHCDDRSAATVRRRRSFPSPPSWAAGSRCR